MKELRQLSIDSVKHNVSSSTDTLFTEMTVARKSEVNIKMLGEMGVPWINGCTFMPNGYVVLCDLNNHNIKLLSDTFTIKDSLKLYSYPWDVSPVSSSSVVITLPNKNQLQFIQVMPSLELGRSINVGSRCLGVQVVEDLIYVTCYNDPGEGEAIVLDMNGTVTHRLGQPDKKPPMFSSPRYITVCPSTREMFIADEDTDTVSCLMSDGTVVYRYKDEDLRKPRGVCVDGGGNIIVCGRRSHNVQVIRADGTKCCTLLTSQDGVSGPYSVAYRESDNTLILGCDNNSNLLVYKMK